MIKIFRRTLKEKEIVEQEKLKAGSWVKITSPDKKDLEFLEKNTPIKKEFLEDAKDPYEMPRIEREGGVLYIFLRAPLEENHHLKTYPLLLAVDEKNFYTISSKDFPFFKKFLEGKVEIFTTQTARFLIQVLIEITLSFEGYLKKLSKEISRKKERLKRLRNEDIVFLVEMEEVLSDFHTSLVANISVIEKILSGKFIALYKEDEDLIEDLLIDTRQTQDFCKTNLKRVINIREAYSTILSNNLNQIIKFLTSMTIILTVPTIISSIYGMNVALPFGENPFAFFYIMFLTLLLCTLLIFIFLKKDWL